ncbi:DNA repair protein RAD50-like [Gigantopelta aegis]|uniref:DNA repair protein RAD50-like n=1 Tax=Gigantopelta aegis TaxID=1735272 RepID=UPI001B88D6AC|nr:DNA repair protein RAD50-like [Gigantopelta aegis]
MSTIEKLSIQGIRSFGPEDTDKQIIHFFTPLTLILGPNGTGKTTIIECLRYMTSGFFPPGAKGGAFIHDPKVAHEREVKGQIRLQLRDVTNQQCIVQRSMTATQKLKKVEMRTLDGVITRRGADGEKKSITSKCAELDREMVAALGVSKAVLDNVIFCHQEDANWPLCEGKALKEKFDAIFASTRYTKVLETIRKLKQEQDQNIKICREELKYLKQHKEKASELEGNLSELEAKFAASKESVEKINTQLVPIEDKLQQINTKANEIHDIKLRKQKATTNKEHLEKSIEELQENIENDFPGSTSELKKTLSQFERKVQDSQETLQEFKHRQDELSRELDRLGREKSQILVEVGKLEQEAENREDSVKKRDSIIRKLATEYQFEGFERGDITTEKYRNFFENMKKKLETMMNEAKEKKAQYEDREMVIQKKIEELQVNKTKHEQSIHMKQNIMTKNSAEIRNINQKLSQMDVSVGRLEHLIRDLKRAEHDLETAEQAVDTNELKRDTAEKEKERRRLDSALSELDSEMNRLHRQSNAQAQLDMFKKDKVSKTESIERLKAKHEDAITYLIGHMPQQNIRGQIQDYMGTQDEMVKSCSVELQKAKQECSAKEAEKNMISVQIKQCESKIRDMEERLNNVCSSENFGEEFETVQTKVEQAQDAKGSLMGAEHFFKKYVKDLEKEKPFCPLCHRGFDDDQEVRELILELKQKLRLVPAQLEKADSSLSEYKTKYDNMIQLKPVKENIAKLQNADLPALKADLQRLSDEIRSLKETIQNKEDELQTKDDDAQMAKNMHSDIVLMDRYYGEIRELDKKIASQQAMMSGTDSARTLEVVIQEKEDIQLKLDTLNRQLDRQRQKLNDHLDSVQRLRVTVNKLKEEKLKIDSELQQRTKLEETKTTLASDNKTLQDEIEDAKTELVPLDSQITKQKTEKDKITAEKEKKNDEAKDEMERVRRNGSEVKAVNQDIKQYDQSGKGEKLVKCKDRQKTLVSSLGEKEQEQEEITENVNALTKELATQQIRQRELNDILQLRNKEEEIKSLQVQIEELTKQLGGFDVMNLERERRKLVDSADNLQKERNIAQGRQQGFRDQIQTSRKELKTDMFKDAKVKYRDKMIEMRTTELANSDLQKYYTAMDRAIMNYHNQKMSEINKIIRELWRNTYRGNDIETIEICSGNEDGGELKSRRSYNYRVVMVKGDAALDMRGRCSAGQKVLASLIIRLALAETFCVNCGVLALDEPTTNLDRENIESLAYALVEIIKARSPQKNFQLVVITHDEDFVEMLGRSSYVDEFYKVRKNPAGCSQIVKARVQDLHMR